MHRRTARGNRLGLALAGLVLVAAGIVLFGAHDGWFGVDVAHTAVYPATARRFVHDHGNWLWVVVAVVAGLVGLVFLHWLLVQPRIDRLRRLRIDTDNDAEDGAGRTRMPADAISDVVEDDLVALPGVRHASVTMSGRADAPELWLRVTADADADVGRIRHVVMDDVVRDARTCLDIDDLPTYLRLKVDRRDGPRRIR